MPKYKCFSCMKSFISFERYPEVSSGGSCPYCGTLITDNINLVSESSLSQYSASAPTFLSKQFVKHPRLMAALWANPVRIDRTSDIFDRRRIATLKLWRFPTDVAFPDGWKCHIKVKNAHLYLDSASVFDFSTTWNERGVVLEFNEHSPAEWFEHIMCATSGISKTWANSKMVCANPLQPIWVEITITNKFNTVMQVLRITLDQWVMAHHLQPIKKVVVALKIKNQAPPPLPGTVIKPCWEIDKAMHCYIKALQSALPKNIEVISIKSKTSDLWMRDMYFSGTFLNNDGKTVSSSIVEIPVKRNKESIEENSFKEDVAKTLLSYGVVVERFSDSHNPISDQESGGNFMCMPPTAKFPRGCIILGAKDYGRILPNTLESFTGKTTCKFLQFLQCRQPIFSIDTSWLQVGHVDEILTFIPWKNTRFGFKIAIPSTNLAKELLEKPQTLSVLLNKHSPFANGFLSNINNTKSLLARQAFMQAHFQVQQHLNEMKIFCIKHLGLLKDEIVELPVAFVKHKPAFSFLGGIDKQEMVSVFPNPVNMLVATEKPTVLCISEPYILEFRNFIEKALSPSGCKIQFIDDLLVCHVNYGNIHCSTLDIRL